MIQTIVEQSKYINDENFLKPVKRKPKKQTKLRKSRRKRKHRAQASMTLEEYQQILDRVKRERAKRTRDQKSGDEIPQWAKLAVVSEVPNQ
jgi:hypothetical protein